MILDIPYNFHWIERGEAARAAQAYAGFLRPFLRAHGVRAVVNLRGSNPDFRWWRYEMRVCGGLRIVHCDAKLNSRQLPTQDMLVRLLNAFDSLPRPMLLKCSGGQDRTSIAAAIYVLHRHGWCAFANAETQFAIWPYLHWPHRQQRWLKLFLPFAREQGSDRPLRQWIEKDYSAAAFRDWLEAQGEGRAFRGLYGVRAASDGH